MLFPCHRHIHHGQNHASGRTTSREQNRVSGRCLTVWATSTQHRWCFGRWNIVGPSVRPRKAMGVDQFRFRSEAPQANNSASRKSTRAFGSQASCTMISDISTWSRKPCNPATTRPARGCHPCLRAGPENFGGPRQTMMSTMSTLEPYDGWYYGSVIANPS